MVITTVSGSGASLVNGTPYNVKIRARNSVGAGPGSATFAMIPGIPPGPPDLSEHHPGQYPAERHLCAGTPGSNAITTYQYSLDGGAWTTRASGTPASPLVITGLTNGTTYDVRIRAVNGVPLGPSQTC